MSSGAPGRFEPSASREALPSTLARALAFAAILTAGLFGGLIGFAFVDLQYGGDGALLPGIGALIGATVAASGVAVVAVLALRAMTEWHTAQQRHHHEARDSRR